MFIGVNIMSKISTEKEVKLQCKYSIDMALPKKRGLFLFHRDLRILDNVGLQAAARECDQLYTVFIFTPEQVSKANRYKSKAAVSFMIECLDDLAKQIRDSGGKLLFLYGHTKKILTKLIVQWRIDAVYCNQDYTPYAMERDQQIDQLCKRAQIECKMFHDYCLYVPGSIVSGNQRVYQKFTPFYKAALDTTVPTPSHVLAKTLSVPGPVRDMTPITLDEARHVFLLPFKGADQVVVHGGRTEALDQLRKASQLLANYEHTRDQMAIKTSLLSAAIKFGCVSIREVYYAFYKKYGKNHEYIRQLIWRDFFAHLLYAYPESLSKMHFAQYEHIPWRRNLGHLEAWKSGETGFPLVDACMRQLNQTGYMHNRGRMVVANFLVKTLLLDWREGERYFATHLVDYDVASNLGNWQSIVGGGTYSTAWFRDMNPWIQSAKYDRDAVYIKTWVPELEHVEARDIHRWNVACQNANYRSTVRYPAPIVDYAEQKEEFYKLYREHV